MNPEGQKGCSQKALGAFSPCPPNGITSCSLFCSVLVLCACCGPAHVDSQAEACQVLAPLPDTPAICSGARWPAPEPSLAAFASALLAKERISCFPLPSVYLQLFVPQPLPCSFLDSQTLLACRPASGDQMDDGTSEQGRPSSEGFLGQFCRVSRGLWQALDLRRMTLPREVEGKGRCSQVT